MNDLHATEEELDEIAGLDYLLNSNDKPGCCLFSLILLLTPAALVAVAVETLAKLLL